MSIESEVWDMLPSWSVEGDGMPLSGAREIFVPNTFSWRHLGCLYPVSVVISIDGTLLVDRSRDELRDRGTLVE